MPSAKYALALSSLKFSNGITAMLFSEIADARAELFGCWRCQKRKLPTTDAAIATEAAMIRTGLRDGARSLAAGTKSVFCVGIVRRFGLSELPSSAVKRITMQIFSPFFTSHSPR